MKRISISKVIRHLRSYLNVYATGEERKGIEKAITIFESMEEEK
ncbi:MULTISPECIES: hypothetical protein [Enterococcus]|uniref:Uncharacterized protein n=1 Tax=Enterococcus mundtii TaxID=53346 RepID=A0A242L003_ENTMU|nr:MULTISPECIES: hypothetical protein [Enterococcus]MDO7880371.1 hypothetical protein [Enterococcus mundtii]OTP26942.1 hypothetical protein A5802_000676 [Enterococcus mundtii]